MLGKAGPSQYASDTEAGPYEPSPTTSKNAIICVQGANQGSVNRSEGPTYLVFLVGLVELYNTRLALLWSREAPE
ncbi:Hypothetical protein FKW44_001045 [Caligus rogercresseyi]|uniref:Uncharacterized protein n=1 Tax=Caligus rogercresseyi TaxID=217165 RepID=A0A7T8KI84_CALRO|nr:Hypothetical protein FKW44_001045 [Caligus rogercresseyi]